MAVAQRNPVIGQTFTRLKRLSANEEAQMLYEDRLKHQRDIWSREDAARMEGWQEGIEEANRKNAKAMKANGIDVQTISIITGLSVEEILRL